VSFRLVCKKCGAWEWRREWTECPPCPHCHSARYAENDKGETLYVVTKGHDPSSWNAEE